MTSSEASDLRRLPELFDLASELSGEERRAFLERECGDDAGLRAQVEELLAHDERPLEAFDDARIRAGRQFDPAPPTSAPLAVGARVGRYSLIGVLGSGGMGTVWEARQDDPRRTIALKVLRTGSGSAEVLRRFRHEAQILGRLQHPGIAQVFEAGEFEDASGTHPFIAMELVDGVPLTDYVETHALSVPARLELFARVCDAVHHAHEKLVVHRDLKPSNILVDGQGAPKVLDFGVARVTDADSALESLQTRTGQLLGTLPYMSPEQVGGDPAAVDLRSDVYALGVLAFELLTGQLPYELARKSLPEAARVIREDPPRRLASLDPALRGDLSVIVDRALAKEAAHRYASANELAADLRRHLAGREILARPTGAIVRATRFVRRYRTLSVAAAITFIALTTALAISLTKTREARDARDETGRHLATAELEGYRANLAAAAASLRAGEPEAARQLLDSVREDLRHWEWRYYSARIDQCIGVAFDGEDEIAEGFSPDGDQVLSLSRAGVLRRRSFPSLGLVEEVALEQLEGGELIAAEFSLDGRRVVAAEGADSFTLSLWDTASGARLASLAQLDSAPTSLSVDEVGRRIAWSDELHASFTWDSQGGTQRPLPTGRKKSPRRSGMALRGDLLLTSLPHGFARLYRISGEEIETRSIYVRGSQVTAVAISPDGELLALGFRDTSIRLYRTSVLLADDVESERAGASAERTLRAFYGELSGHHGRVDALEFGSPGEGVLYSGSQDQTLRRWDVEACRLLEVLTGSRTPIHRLAFGPRSAHLLSRGRGDDLRLWSPGAEEVGVVLPDHQNFVYSVASSSSSRWLASGGWDGALRVFELATGDALHVSRGNKNVNVVTWSPDERFVAFGGGWNQPVALFDLEFGEVTRELGGGGGLLHAVAWLPDGERLLIARGSRQGPEGRSAGGAQLMDVATGETIEELPHLEEGARSLCVSPDGRRVAVGTSKGDLLLWDPDAHEVLSIGRVAESSITSVAFDPEGERLALSTTDGAVGIWDVDGPRRIVSLEHHRGAVWDVAFSPDGRRLATGCHDSFIRVFDATTGAQVAQLRGHDDYVHALEFTPDGRALVSGSGAGSVRIWDTRPRRERAAARAAGPR